MTTNSKSLNAALSFLYAFAESYGKATVEQASASSKLILAAISGREAYAEAVETFYERIRANVDGLADKTGAQPAKEPGRFTIPGSLMAQVSQVSRAVKLGVKLGTLAKPRKIGEIRKDTAKAAKDAAEREAEKQGKEALAKLTPEQRKDVEIRAGLVAALTELANTVGTVELSSKDLAELHALTVDFIEAASKILPNGAQPAETSADDKGAAMAKAA